MARSKECDALTDKMLKDSRSQAPDGSTEGHFKSNERDETENKEEKTLLLTEANVKDIYKKLINNEMVPEEELAAVQKRFSELCDYKRI